MADFTEKTFTEYYGYFKNLNDFVEANSINDMPIPEHLEVCHTLRGDGDSDEYDLVVVELDKGDGTNGTWIGVNENLYQKIKPLEGNYKTFWNYDILFRQSKTSSCGCFGASIDIKSVKDSAGNKNTPEFESSWHWRTPTGSGVTPNLDSYYFYEASSFPCENCVIPVAVNPNTYKNVEESKRGGGFITGIWYAHPIVSNPWVSCVANLKRFTYNTHDPSTHDWIINELKMDQQNNCIDRQYIAWDPNDIGKENFTFKASVVFYKDKFKCTTYPSYEDCMYPLSIVKTLQALAVGYDSASCTADNGGYAPYIKNEELQSGSITPDLILSRWNSTDVFFEDELPDGRGLRPVLILPYFYVMAVNYDICVTNFFELCISHINQVRGDFSACIDAAIAGSAGGGIDPKKINDTVDKINKKKKPICEDPPCYVSTDYHECGESINANLVAVCGSTNACFNEYKNGKVKGKWEKEYPNTEQGWTNAANDILEFYDVNVASGSSYVGEYGLTMLSDGNLAFRWILNTYQPKTQRPALNEVIEEVKSEAEKQQPSWECASEDADNCTLWRRNVKKGRYKVIGVYSNFCVCGYTITYVGYEVSCQEIEDTVYTRASEGNRPFYIGNYAMWTNDILNSDGMAWSISSSEHQVLLTEPVKIGSCDGYKALVEDERKILGISD